jgi:hypothetical protein
MAAEFGNHRVGPFANVLIRQAQQLLADANRLARG